MIVFVTPAYQRYELTNICLEQRALLCTELKPATCVVVADDANLGLAYRWGFHTVEQNNEYLGRRFSDGIEYAYKVLEADYVVPIGSDSWVHASYFKDLMPDQFRSSHLQQAYSPDGTQSIDLYVEERRQPGGVWPFVIPKTMLVASNGRPCRYEIQQGCDYDTYTGLGKPEPVYVDLFPAQYTSFKSVAIQKSQYHKVAVVHGQSQKARNGTEVFEHLAQYYPQHLVAALQRYYGQ